eukprot:1100113-Rhodomonas_salina.1
MQGTPSRPDPPFRLGPTTDPRTLSPTHVRPVSLQSLVPAPCVDSGGPPRARAGPRLIPLLGAVNSYTPRCEERGWRPHIPACCALD